MQDLVARAEQIAAKEFVRPSSVLLCYSMLLLNTLQCLSFSSASLSWVFGGRIHCSRRTSVRSRVYILLHASFERL